MSITAMWMHGSAIVVESSENIVKERRYGFGTQTWLKPRHDCWYHASMPTPVIVADRRPKHVKVIILFKSDPRLEDVHIFDASRRVHEISEPLSYGDHLTMDQYNTFSIRRPIEISYGLGISFRFHADLYGPEPYEVFIAAVGADFRFDD